MGSSNKMFSDIGKDGRSEEESIEDGARRGPTGMSVGDWNAINHSLDSGPAAALFAPSPKLKSARSASVSAA